VKKTLVSPVFILDVTIKNINPHYGQVWMQVAGVPGWASTLSFSTEIVGSDVAEQQITDFLKGLSFVPAENDADYQEAATEFAVELVNQIATESPAHSIASLVKLCLENTSASTHFGNEHLTIMMTLTTSSEVYYNNDNFMVHLESEKLNIVTSAPLPLIQVAESLQPVLGCRSRAIAVFESIPVNKDGVPQLPRTIETHSAKFEPVKITISKP
jgi:hypothetical protein